MYFNWVDAVIVAVFLYALIDGWRRGFIALLANFVSFLGSLWFAVRFHGVVGSFIMQTFGLAQTWGTALGYIATGALSQLVIETAMLILFSRIRFAFIPDKTDTWLGSIVSGINALVISAFVLLLMLSLPLKGTVKDDIRTSFLGTGLVRLAETYGGEVRSSLKDFAESASKFLTVEPGSEESISLDLPPDWSNIAVDKAAESSMLGLLNTERISRGLSPLTVDGRLTSAAEDKSRNMFERRYFSHYDPDGRDAADRLKSAGIPFTIVGENLAYAPDVTTAHRGLMQSEGHRENMLDGVIGLPANLF